FLPNTALCAQFACRILNFSEHGVERLGIDARMLAQAAERNALPFEFLQNPAPQIVTVADIEQIEQGSHRNQMMEDVRASRAKKNNLSKRCSTLSRDLTRSLQGYS